MVIPTREMGPLSKNVPHEPSAALPTAASTTIMSLYQSQRNAPEIFPSFDRLRFVRLPPSFLPSSSTTLQHWPALIYSNIAELLRDLPSDTSNILKARLAVEHYRFPKRVVGRLIGWIDENDDCPDSVIDNKVFHSGKKSRSSDVNQVFLKFFAPQTFKMLHLSESSIRSSEKKYKEWLPFYEALSYLDELCERIILNHSAENNELGRKDLRHALRFREAFDTALNYLALDLGENPIPLRESGALSWSDETKCAINTFNIDNVDKETVQTPTSNIDKCIPNVSQKSDCVADKNSNESRNISCENPTDVLWKHVWKVMLKHGWTWKRGNGLCDYMYLTPNFNKVSHSVEGIHFFTSEKDLHAIAMEYYGWKTLPIKEMEMRIAEYARRGNQTSRLETKIKSKELQKLKYKQNYLKQRSMCENTILNKERVDQFINPSEVHSKEKENIQHSISKLSTASALDQKVIKEQIINNNDSQLKHLLKTESDKNSTPPIKGSPIQPNESWRDAWEKMLDSGWSWKSGSGMMLDYFYLKPGCKIKKGKEGKDYFTNRKDLEFFMEQKYGWKGNKNTICCSSQDVNYKLSGQKRASLTLDTQKQESSSKHSMVKHVKTTKASDCYSNYKDKCTLSKFINSIPSTDINDFKTLWPTLKNNGWSVVSAGKYNKLHDWYWIRPGCNPGDSMSRLGEDFFLSESDVLTYLKKEQESMPGVQSQFCSISKQDETIPLTVKPYVSTPNNSKTKPKDPGIPLHSSSEGCFCQDSMKPDSFYAWNNLWPTLQKAGWNVVSAGRYNKLHDWYYVRPNRDPGDCQSKLGLHYFTSQDDVITFIKALDAKIDSKSVKRRRSIDALMAAFEEEAKDMVFETSSI